MPVSKLKNLVILILLLANIALLCLLLPRFAGQRQQVEDLRSALSSLCAEQNVDLDPDAIPETVTLYTLELADIEAAETAAMTVLLGETPIRTDAVFQTADSDLRIGTWENGSNSLRLQNQKEVSDQKQAAKKLLRDMGISVLNVSEPERISPGIYTLTATQSVLGVPVFSRGISLTYSNSALSHLEGDLFAGTLTRTDDTACISASEAVVAFLAARVDTGWVGSAITALEQGYFRAESAASAIRLSPVWKLTTDTGSFLINGLSREVIPAV